MSIRFVILGLLAEQPLHGYAIQAALEERFGELCDPAFGEVYRVLAALGRDGLVTAATDRIGRRPRRKVHAPTAAGRRALHAWLRGEPVAARARRDDPWLRLLVAERCAPELLPALAEDEVRRRQHELRELEMLRPSPRGSPGFAALVLGLRHASALEAARAALHSAELCREALRAQRGGVPVGTLLHAIERGDLPGASVRATGRRPPGGAGATG